MQVALCLAWSGCKGVVRSMGHGSMVQRGFSVSSSSSSSPRQLVPSGLKGTLRLPSTSSPQTQPPALSGPPCLQPLPHWPPKVLLPNFETWRAEAPMPTACSTPAIQHLFLAGAQQGSRAALVRVTGWPQGPHSILA